MFRTTIYVFLSVIAFVAASCGKGNEQELLPYAISPDELETIIQEKEHTLLLFWTGWCGGATSRISSYIKDQDEVTKKGLDIQLILIAADADISTEQIEAQRKAGIQSYYLKDAGTHSFKNRKVIKQFIDKLVSGKQLQQLNGSSGNFGIPVELIMNKQMEIKNPENEASAVFLFMCAALNRKCSVEKIEQK